MPENTVYLGTKKAAEYVGLSLAAFKWHVHIAKHLAPDTYVGRSMGFTYATLDTFKKSLKK